MWNPLSWVMEAAAIMAIALANGDVRPLSYHVSVCSYISINVSSLMCGMFFLFHFSSLPVHNCIITFFFMPSTCYAFL